MKPEEVEHSKARAEERGKPIGFEWLNDDRDSLGNPLVVEGLVRSFLGFVSGVRKDYNADAIEGPDATLKIDAEAGRLADIFLGKSKVYMPLGYNSVQVLGNRLVTAGFGGDPEASTKEMFLSAASRLMDAMVEHENGTLPDEDIPFRTGVIIDDTMEYLMGASLDRLIPQPDPFGDDDE
jgi:hypothetical protein